jgi:hypothetical protein
MRLLRWIGSATVVTAALAACATGGAGDDFAGAATSSDASSSVDAGADVTGRESGGNATADANGASEAEAGADTGYGTSPGSGTQADASGALNDGGSQPTAPDSGDASATGGCTAVAVSPAEPAHGDGACSSTTGSCYPHSVTSLSPTWVPPLGSHTGACTAKQISAYFDACLGPNASNATCGTFTNAPSNAACVSCIDTPDTATSFGALIDNGVVVYVNLGGCVALVEPCNLACAQAFQAVAQCTTTACAPNLYCTNANSYSACEQAAQGGSCACDGFVAAGACMNSIAAAGHPAYTTCFGSQPSDFQATYTAVATFICGQ